MSLLQGRVSVDRCFLRKGSASDCALITSFKYAALFMPEGMLHSFILFSRSVSANESTGWIKLAFSFFTQFPLHFDVHIKQS